MRILILLGLLFPSLVFATTQADIEIVEVDSLRAHFTIAFDDSRGGELPDSIGIFSDADVIKYTSKPIVGTHFVITYDMVSGAAASMTVAEVMQYKNLGWEIAAHNRNGPDVGTLWKANASGEVITGELTSFHRFQREIEGAVSELSAYGLGRPKSYSFAQNTGSYELYRLLKAAGFECATSSIQLPGPGTGDVSRWNSPHRVQMADGVWDVQKRFSAAYGDVGSRYEIPSALTTSSTEIQIREALMRAVEHNGWVVFLLHEPSDLTDWSLSEALQYVDSLRATGRLEVVTFYEGYQEYFKRPVGELANWISPTFADTDSGQHFDNGELDQMSASDSLTVVRSGGYQGRGYALCNWRLVTTLATWSIQSPGRPGDRVLFEAWVQYDPALHTSGADSVGVVFTQTVERQPNTNGTTAQAEANRETSDDAVLAHFDIAAKDSVGGEWRPIRFTVELSDASYLGVSFWKSATFAEDALRISNPSVRVVPRGGDWTRGR